jgi:hypothetical protein
LITPSAGTVAVPPLTVTGPFTTPVACRMPALFTVIALLLKVPVIFSVPLLILVAPV